MSIPRRWVVIVVGIALLVAACDHGPGHSVEQLPRQAESEHFVFHFATGDHVDVTWQEGYYDWLVEELEVQVPKKMNYFKYRDRSHLEHLTGKNGNGYADSRAYSFHTIWPIDNHESVHVVVFNTIGRASALFDEGIAVAHQVDPTGPDERPQWSGTDIHEIARDHYRAGTIPALSSLLKSTAFRTHDPNTTYPLAGSFVRYLIDTSGLPPLKNFIAESGPNDGARKIRTTFQSAFGEDVDHAWARWQSFLDNFPE